MLLFNRASIVFLLAVVLSAPPPLAAQEEPVAGEPAPGLQGSWEGWAKLTNDWTGFVCQYDTGEAAAAVRLELGGEAGRLRGSLAVDIPAVRGSGCPPLRKRYAVDEVTEGPGTVVFTDSGGNEWTLALRREGRVLQGLMAWRPGGPDEPLAEGFRGASGERPATRLSGEVRLKRVGAGEVGAGEVGAGEVGAGEKAAPGPATDGASPAAAAATPRKTGAGTHVKNVGIVLGANVVGLALLYGANKLGKGSAENGVITCSPRFCTVPAPNQTSCFCENNILSGAPCGSTLTGLQNGEEGCNRTSKPCQAGLSCNSGRCEDPISGRCPNNAL